MFRCFASLIVILGILWGAVGNGHAQSTANPFTTSEAAPASSQAAPRGKWGGAVPPLVGNTIKVLTQWQLAIRSTMAAQAGEVAEHPYGRAFWTFLLFAFVYGFIHAMGPGHGKIFAAGYFMNRPDGLWLGFVFGFLTMGFHVLSATILVVGGFLLLGGSDALVNGAGVVFIEPVSFGLVMLLGAFMTFDALREMRRGKRREYLRGHGEEIPPWAGRGRLWSMAFAAGMVPCPGAAMVLIFSITLGIAHAGYAAMLAISLGMGLALSCVSVTTALFRGMIMTAVNKHQRVYALLHHGVSLCGSLVLFFLGGLLLLGSLRLG